MIQAKTLVGGLQLSNTVTVLYTCPDSTTAIVTHAVFVNTDNSSHTVSAYIVPAGGGPDGTTIVLDAKSLNVDQSYISGELIGVVLPPGATIQASASVASKVAVYISGFTQT